MKRISALILICLVTLACALTPTVDQSAVQTVVAEELARDIKSPTVVPTGWGVPTFRPPIQVTPLPASVLSTEPVGTPIPSLTIAVPTPIPAVIKKNGSNTGFVLVPEMVPGYRFVGITNSGDAAFAVFGSDAAGNKQHQFVNTTGAYSGWHLIAGDLIIPRFDVVSNGEWTIELRPDVKDAVPLITAPAGHHGEGDTVLAVYCCTAHRPDVADFTYAGEGNFSVYATSKTGERIELINQQGPYQGQVGMPSRLVFLEVYTTGGWDMNMTEKPEPQPEQPAE